MTIATEDAYYAALAAAQRVFARKAALAISASAGNSFLSSWKLSGYPAAGATPGSTSGVTCSSATPGALPFANAPGGQISQLGRVALVGTPGGGHIVLMDRLVHSDGLSANTNAAQTVGTPTLPRATDGVGVEIWIECYAAPGAAGASVSVSYTNTAGVSGRTATAVSVNGFSSTTMFAGRAAPCALAAGDVGVKSVQSVTFSTPSGAAGNFGVTLCKPIIACPVVGEYTGATTFVPFVLGPHQTLMAQVPDAACLYYLAYVTSTSIGPYDLSALLLQG